MAPRSKQELNIEQIYQKKTPIEHVLLRPDTYIGSTAVDLQQMWVWDDQSSRIVKKNINFSPGLYKIFDEILVNASDNKQRDPNMTCIKIDIDIVSNAITIMNDGRGIPVIIHKDEKIYVPTLIFGQLLTSSNFNDSEKKITGGRNGYGAKLCNIFSHSFKVETASNEHKKKFCQVWENNMSSTSDPIISPHSGPDYTRVTFVPDLKRFNMSALDPDFVSLLKRRAYDIAGTTRGIKVYLNGVQIEVKSFETYAALYSNSEKGEEESSIPKIIHERVSDRWEVCLLPSDGSFQHVSFVNSIATTKGGTHVNYVVSKLTDKLMDEVTKKMKSSKIQPRPQHIRQHLWIFINCLIENPCFDSQTKENMTLQEKEFGSTCDFSDKFLKKVSSEFVENISSWYETKMKAELAKKGATVKRSRLYGYDKLEDAPHAGTKKSLDCTLILTEGDSAKTLAMAGLGVLDRSNYGVFPLRGKFINIRETSTKSIMDNKEVEALVKIIGLDFKKQYSSREMMESLRYGKVMIMADQDQDGSHIKGLIINFFHCLWPNLVKSNFIEEFITPIVKVTKGSSVKSFYSIPEYEEWKKETRDYKSYGVKYYKGLGTSSTPEAKEYFSDMDRHRIFFSYSGQPCDDAIVLAFSKTKIEERKKWLDSFQLDVARRREYGLPDIYLYHKNTKSVTYCDFINKELVLFSHSDNVRSIPSMVDGLKPGQRKVLYTLFKKKCGTIKVNSLAGAVMENAAYHHGDASLNGTIVTLAHDFVGSNNIALLQAEGQFGSRLKGGKDFACPRYLSTSLSPLTRAIFPMVDDPLLTYLYEDNQSIEPEWYCPIIPMVLVNGAEGIGTGYATKVPNFNPRDIITNIKLIIDGKEPLPMKPYYRGFTGLVTEVSPDKFITTGRAYICENKSIEVAELPIGTWTDSFKDSVLTPNVKSNGAKGKLIINDYKNFGTESVVSFFLELSAENLNNLDDNTIAQELNLQSSLHTSSMLLFDEKCVLHKYGSAIDIIKDFYATRLKKYTHRRLYCIEKLSAEIALIDNQVRFILEKISGKIVIENKKKSEIIKILVDNKFVSDPVKAWLEKAKATLANLEELIPQQDKDEETGEYDFNYLLNMTLWSLTFERKEKLLELRDCKYKELDDMKNMTPQKLWLADLDNLSLQLDLFEEGKLKQNKQTAAIKKAKKAKIPEREREISLVSLTNPSAKSSKKSKKEEKVVEEPLNDVNRELVNAGDDIKCIESQADDNKEKPPAKKGTKNSEKTKENGPTVTKDNVKSTAKQPRVTKSKEPVKKVAKKTKGNISDELTSSDSLSEGSVFDISDDSIPIKSTKAKENGVDNVVKKKVDTAAKNSSKSESVSTEDKDSLNKKDDERIKEGNKILKNSAPEAKVEPLKKITAVKKPTAKKATKSTSKASKTADINDLSDSNSIESIVIENLPVLTQSEVKEEKSIPKKSAAITKTATKKSILPKNLPSSSDEEKSLEKEIKASSSTSKRKLESRATKAKVKSYRIIESEEDEITKSEESDSFVISD